MPKIIKDGVAYGSGLTLPIATTISKNSTHDEVSTAKAVADKLLKVEIGDAVLKETYINTTKTNYVQYATKNGMCYVNYYLNLNSSASLTYTTMPIASGLPIPIMRGYVGSGTIDGTGVCECQIWMENNGTLGVTNTNSTDTMANKVVRGGFVYIMA